jgi:nucleoside phosphorylase
MCLSTSDCPPATPVITRDSTSENRHARQNCCLFPTATEASLFRSDDVISIVSGVGLTCTAYATMKAIYEHRPDWLILSGIAGVLRTPA